MENHLGIYFKRNKSDMGYWERPSRASKMHFHDIYLVSVCLILSLRTFCCETPLTLTASSLLSGLNLIYSHKCAIMINQ